MIGSLLVLATTPEPTVSTMCETGGGDRWRMAYAVNDSRGGSPSSTAAVAADSNTAGPCRIAPTVTQDKDTTGNGQHNSLT